MIEKYVVASLTEEELNTLKEMEDQFGYTLIAYDETEGKQEEQTPPPTS